MICLRCNHYRNADRELAGVQGSDDCSCSCHDPFVSSVMLRTCHRCGFPINGARCDRCPKTLPGTHPNPRLIR